MNSERLLPQYQALQNSAGFVELPNATLIRLSGDDAEKFLNSFCTADINRLAAGTATEAFVLDSRGKSLAFGHILRTGSELLLCMPDAKVGKSLCEHFDRYIIREQVSVSDESESHQLFFVPSPDSEAIGFLNEKIGVNQVVETRIGDLALIVSHVDCAGYGKLLVADTPVRAAIREWLESCGLQRCDLESLQLIRLENGTPWFGTEIEESNLPQEIQRDESAISFNKGCYLGQETVARIDAIGHVNRLLVQATIEGGTIPEPGDPVSSGDAEIGQVKSAVHSPRFDAILAFVLVKREYGKAKTALKIGDSEAKVLE